MSNERAEADLRRLHGEAESLRAKLADVESRISKLEIYLEMARVYGAGDVQLPYPTASGTGHVAIARRSPPSGISGKSVELTKAVLREAGHPIHTRDLLKILAAQDVHVGGANPVANLSGFLSKSNDLTNSRKHGWSLAEWSSEFGPGPVAKEEERAQPPAPTEENASNAPDQPAEPEFMTYGSDGTGDFSSRRDGN